MQSWFIATYVRTSVCLCVLGMSSPGWQVTCVIQYGMWVRWAVWQLRELLYSRYSTLLYLWALQKWLNQWWASLGADSCEPKGSRSATGRGTFGEGPAPLQYIMYLSCLCAYQLQPIPCGKSARQQQCGLLPPLLCSLVVYLQRRCHLHGNVASLTTMCLTTSST